jgi:hypothetical protein
MAVVLELLAILFAIGRGRFVEKREGRQLIVRRLGEVRSLLDFGNDFVFASCFPFLLRFLFPALIEINGRLVVSFVDGIGRCLRHEREVHGRHFGRWRLEHDRCARRLRRSVVSLSPIWEKHANGIPLERDSGQNREERGKRTPCARRADRRFQVITEESAP